MAELLEASEAALVPEAWLRGVPGMEGCWAGTASPSSGEASLLERAKGLLEVGSLEKMGLIAPGSAGGIGLDGE